MTICRLIRWCIWGEKSISAAMFFPRLTLGLIAIAVALGTPIFAEECSIAKTNHSCTLTIDRKNPLAPPTIQMYPGQKLTVVVKNPYYFERYFLDYSSGQVSLAPDVATSIVSSGGGGLLASLKSLGQWCTFQQQLPVPPPPPDCSVSSVLKRIPAAAANITDDLDSFYTGCLNDFAAKAKNIYHRLEPAIAPDAHPQGTVLSVPEESMLEEISREIIDLYQREVQLSNAIGQAGKLDTIVPPTTPGAATTAPAAGAVPPPAPGTPTLTADKANMVRNWVAAVAVADAVAKDLYGYSFRLSDLYNTLCSLPPESADQKPACAQLPPTISLGELIDPPTVDKKKMVTRQLTLQCGRPEPNSERSRGDS